MNNCCKTPSAYLHWHIIKQEVFGRLVARSRYSIFCKVHMAVMAVSLGQGSAPAQTHTPYSLLFTPSPSHYPPTPKIYWDPPESIPKNNCTCKVSPEVPTGSNVSHCHIMIIPNRLRSCYLRPSPSCFVPGCVRCLRSRKGR